jgi:uncharacterized protein YlzI (FlbEa/FlbD family)
VKPFVELTTINGRKVTVAPDKVVALFDYNLDGTATTIRVVNGSSIDVEGSQGDVAKHLAAQPRW